MSTVPSFVAITPAHNEADRIGALVRSMAEQTLRPDRWIVVDDASEDDTAATVEAIAEEIGLTRERVRQIRDRGLDKLRKRSKNFIPTFSEN